MAKAYGPMAKAFTELGLWKRQEDGTEQVEVTARGPDGCQTFWYVPADMVADLALALRSQVQSGMIRIDWVGKESK